MSDQYSSNVPDPVATSPSSTARRLPRSALWRARIVTMAVFFVSGMLYASWGVNIPTVRDKFALDAAQLSVALLAVAGGSIAAMLCVGPWLAKVGTRRAYLFTGPAMGVSASLMLTMPSYIALLAMLALFGVTMATVDVAMNAEASAVENAAAKPIMSSLHGMWSIGGMGGAAAGAALLGLGIAPELHMAVVSLIATAVLLAARGSVLPHVAENRHPPPGKPRSGSRELVLLGSVALIALIAEGAMYDWTTVYMRDIVLTSPAFAGTAYASFSAGMAVARFAGDWIRARLGAPQLVCMSALLACTGMVIALLLPFPYIVLTGFTLMGLGMANMMPVLFAAAANVKGVRAAQGLARVAGMAYVGLLVGPALIGGVAQATTLPIGLSIVALCAALVAVVGPRGLKRIGL
ncbi:MFS transporter [Mycetohabitans endofungorum]|uniref:MFS transporter n=1 Tax=Mycetohabitans endofungorum TaxID=417203 RepID=UPI003969BEA5